jgi:GT2 family glycosyltransferase
MLAASGSIRSFDQFSAANMSGPAELFRGLGGFDERFVGWGYEDLEFGYRLLERGAQILFAPDAGALHDGPARSITELATRARQGGRNLSLLVDLHPGTATVLLPERSWTRRLLRVLTSSRPQVAMAVLRVLARVLLTAASVEWAVGRGTSDALVELLKRVCAMEGLLARTIEAQVPRGSRVG